MERHNAGRISKRLDLNAPVPNLASTYRRRRSVILAGCERQRNYLADQVLIKNARPMD